MANTTSPTVVIHTPVRVAPAAPHPAIAGAVLIPPPPAAVHTATPQPITMQAAVGVQTVNLSALRFFSPGFNLPAVAQNQPRGSFHLPTLISPVAAPNDGTLFEEPQDGSKKHYLPTYTIATAADGSYHVSLEPIGKAYQLVVHLAENTKPEHAIGVRIDDAPTRYWLTATLRGQNRSFEVQEVQDGKTLKLTLAIAQKPDLDWIFQAMTSPESGAQLMLTRNLNLALLGPMQAAVPAIPPRPAQPAVPAVPGRPAIPARPPLFRAIPAIPARPARPAIPAFPGRPAQPAVQLFHLNATTAINTDIPFNIFVKELDQNVFAQVESGVAGKPAPWTIVRIPWKAASYPYYQDRSQPDQFYYLPDAFKIARNSSAQGAPALTVQSNGQTADSVVLTLSYQAVPVWSSDRIAAAQEWLVTNGRSTAPQLALFDASNAALSLKLPPQDPNTPAVLVPQPGAQVQIFPGIKGSVTMKLAQFQQVYDALFDDVSDLFTGQVTVTVNQDATPESEAIPFIARAADFVGDIVKSTPSLELGGNLSCTLTNEIESPIHIDTLSAVLIRDGVSVPATIVQAAPPLPVDLIPASAVKSQASAVVSLIVTFQIQPGQTVDQSTKVVFDYSGTRVIPDAKAIWLAIMTNHVVEPAVRPITVKLLAAVLAPAPAPAPQPMPTASTAAAGTSAGAGTAPSASSTAPSAPTSDAAPAPSATTSDTSPEPILAVSVEFEGQSKTADFGSGDPADSSGFINKIVNLSVPIEQFVLHEADTGKYRYRVHLITRHGQKTGEWSSDDSSPDTLYITVDE